MIVSLPAGEAPLWVRERWVGLELPLAQTSLTPRRVRVGSGVLTGPRSFLSALLAFVSGRLATQCGFIVPVLPALEALRVGAPDAADWWQANCPHLCKPRRYFLFQASECRVVVERGA